MKRQTSAKIPHFRSAAEEREYWETQGPLAEGHRGKVHKPKLGQKRSSFLSVRLTGQELTQVRDIAARLGMGPSTYVRSVLKFIMRQEGLVDPEFKYLYGVPGKSEPGLRPALARSLKDFSKSWARFLPDRKTGKAFCILDPNNLDLTIEALQNLMLNAKTVTSKDDEYKELERIVKARP